MMPSRRFRRPYRQLKDFKALSECLKLDGYTEKLVVTCNAQTQLCKGVGSNGCCKELFHYIKALDGQDAQSRSKARMMLFPSTSFVVPSIILRSLVESWLRSYRLLRRLSLTPQHHLNFLKWYSSRSSWLPSDWHHIVFNDESFFFLEADDHRLRIWRDQCAFVLQRPIAIISDVMVWGATSYDSRSFLVILDTSLTAQRYVDTILRPIILPFNASHPGASFQQASYCSHISGVSLGR
ncbi:transposable element Tc1 transposase [Trichonephila clavipes]|nr:transposable element Tc1 transposase [Trichonephila clavipes]